MTSAGPTQKRARIAVVIGAVAVTLAVPHAAAAAPAPCERAEDYAAQSGAEFLRIDKLDGGDHGRISNVGLAQAKSALVASATVNSAAVTRLLDADRPGAFTEPLVQQAPPTNATPAERATDPGDIGPFALGDGTLTSHARWDPRMACGRSAGEVTRAETTVHDAGIGELLHTTQRLRSRSGTALVDGGRAAAAAGVDMAAFDLLGGAVHVKVVRTPLLTARMSTKDGGEVGYVPAVVEVSGDAIRTRRLDTPGEEFSIRMGDRTESVAYPSTVEDMTAGAPLPLPAVPGLPRLGRQDESAHVSGPGTRLRISLGQVHQATAGYAIAAKATAIRIAITRAPDGQQPANQANDRGRDSWEKRGSGGYGGDAADRGRVVLDLGVGLLEAAAVVPAPHAAGVTGAVSAGGTGAGLPITGSPVEAVAIGGAGLVIAGAAALAFGARRRRSRP
jgi:hypothetical protein